MLNITRRLAFIPSIKQPFASIGLSVKVYELPSFYGGRFAATLYSPLNERTALKSWLMEITRKFRKQVKLPEPVDELKKLEPFVGKWIVEGQNLSGAPIAANTEVAGVQTYEWLPGNFFLVGKWDLQFDNSEHIGIGMFGYDLSKHEFYLTNYDNLGSDNTYDVDSYRHIWKFAGLKERATIIFSSDGQTFIEDWEILNDNYVWQPLCTLKSTKIK